MKIKNVKIFFFILLLFCFFSHQLYSFTRAPNELKFTYGSGWHMDEIAEQYDVPSGNLLNPDGDRTISIITTPNETLKVIPVNNEAAVYIEGNVHVGEIEIISPNFVLGGDIWPMLIIIDQTKRTPPPPTPTRDLKDSSFWVSEQLIVGADGLYTGIEPSWESVTTGLYVGDLGFGPDEKYRGFCHAALDLEPPVDVQERYAFRQNETNTRTLFNIYCDTDVPNSYFDFRCRNEVPPIMRIENNGFVRINSLPTDKDVFYRADHYCNNNRQHSMLVSGNISLNTNFQGEPFPAKLLIKAHNYEQGVGFRQYAPHNEMSFFSSTDINLQLGASGATPENYETAMKFSFQHDYVHTDRMAIFANNTPQILTLSDNDVNTLIFPPSQTKLLYKDVRFVTSSDISIGNRSFSWGGSNTGYGSKLWLRGSKAGQTYYPTWLAKYVYQYNIVALRVCMGGTHSEGGLTQTSGAFYLGYFPDHGVAAEYRQDDLYIQWDPPHTASHTSISIPYNGNCFYIKDGVVDQFSANDTFGSLPSTHPAFAYTIDQILDNLAYQKYLNLDSLAKLNQDHLPFKLAQNTNSPDPSGVIPVIAITANGELYKSSDFFLKKNISYLKNALKTVLNMRAVAYNYYNEPTNTPKSVGLIAQEIEALYPSLVRKGSDNLKSLNYLGLIPVLIEAIKKQDTQIDNYQQEVDALLSELSSLSKKKASK